MLFDVKCLFSGLFTLDTVWRVTCDVWRVMCWLWVVTTEWMLLEQLRLSQLVRLLAAEETDRRSVYTSPVLGCVSIESNDKWQSEILCIRYLACLFKLILDKKKYWNMNVGLSFLQIQPGLAHFTSPKTLFLIWTCSELEGKKQPKYPILVKWCDSNR